MLDDAIEILTKLMLNDSYKDNDSDKTIVVKKSTIYRLCIKMLKLINQLGE